jgi:hypothetical protein
MTLAQRLKAIERHAELLVDDLRHLREDLEHDE